MTFDLSLSAVLLAVTIFALRVLNNGLGTIRVVLITRDMRLWAAILAFIEALIFAVVLSSVVRDLSNILNLMAYCLGFSVGGYVGMALEKRLITSYMIATIITKDRGHELAVTLRELGFGVTETLGEGRDGTVTMLRSVVSRREAPKLLDAVHANHNSAFVSVSEARAIERGWLRPVGNQPR